MPRQVDDGLGRASRTEAAAWHRGPARLEAHAFAEEHERATHALIARGLAALKGYPFAADHDLRRHDRGRVYVAPSDTLLGLDAAPCYGREGKGRPLWRRHALRVCRDQGGQPSTGRARGSRPRQLVAR